MTEHPEHIRLLIEACREYPGLDPRDVLEAIANPSWEQPSRRNDWRNNVASEVADVWDSLGTEARLVAYLESAMRSFME